MAKNILKYVSLTLVVLVMAIIAVIQFPSVQTFLAKKAVTALEDKVQGTISLDKVHLRPFNTIIVKGATLVDSNPFREDARDTLFSAGIVSVKFSLLGLLSGNGITLRQVKISDGQFNLVIEQEGRNNLQRILGIDPEKEPKQLPDKNLLTIRSVVADNLRFGMQNYVITHTIYTPYQINWSDLTVFDISVRASDLKVSGGYVHVNMDHLSAEESTGWKVMNMTAKGRIGKGEALIYDAVLDDESSHAEFDYKMTGRTKDYRDYVNRVKMAADFRNCRMSLQTLAHFIPRLNPDPATHVTLNGHFEGPVADMWGTDLRMKVEGSDISCTLNGGVKYLPKVEKMFINADLGRTRLNTADAQKLVNAIAPRAGLNLGAMANSTTYEGRIRAVGTLDDLKYSLDLTQQGGGQVRVDGGVRNILRHSVQPITVGAKLEAADLDLGTILANDLFGKTTMSAGVDLSTPLGASPLHAELTALDIKSLVFKGHDYNQITGNAAMEGDDLNAELSARDDALVCDISLWSDKYAYNAASTIENADLSAMNLDKRSRSEVGMSIYGRVEKGLGRPQGNINISDVRLTNSDGTTRVDNIAVSAVAQAEHYDISIDSEVLQGSFYGNMKEFDARLETGRTSSLLSFIIPGMYIEKGTMASATLSPDGHLTATLLSGRVALKRNFIKDLNLELDGTLDNFSGKLTSTRIMAGGFNFDDDIITFTRDEDMASFAYTFFSEDGHFSEGDINASVLFRDKKHFDVTIGESSIGMDQRMWDIGSCTICVDNGNITIDSLALTCEDQWFKLHGKTSRTEEALMEADIKNFDLSIIDKLLLQDKFELSGALDLNGKLHSPIGKGIPRLEMSAFADSLKVGEADFGRIYAQSHYDPESKAFIANMNDKKGNHDIMSANAGFYTETGDIRAYASLEKFPFGFAQKFIPMVFSDMSGTVSGNVSLEGKPGNLRMNCRKAKVEDGHVEVAFTKVPYDIDGTFHINDSGIHLDDVLARDRFGNSAVAHGGIKWEKLRHLVMDIGLKANNIEAVNLPSAEDGAVFYGHIFASGDVRFHGPFKSLTLTADAVPGSNSSLYIVIPNQYNAFKTDLLTFLDPYDIYADPYLKVLEKFSRRQQTESGFAFKLHAVADPKLTVHLDMGMTGFAAGMSGVGNGEIDMSITPGKGFNILGDYAVQDGSFEMNVSQIVRKNFKISSGSSIKFGGDIFQSALNIHGDYSTKASLSTLVTDEASRNSSGGRRTVNCGIDITGRLATPAVKFSVDVPDLSPSIKTQVESALNSDDKVQRQFLALLVSGSFMPDEQSGVFNTQSALYSNVSEIMANQLNNIFTRLEIPVDLGLRYENTETGKNLFDVAVSTQLFNNRVIIGGNFGNRLYKNANGSDLFGDLDIQYKVNRNGNFRIKAFSHSADQYSNYLDDSQRNGVGLSWQGEFDRFIPWVSTLFMPRAQKEQKAAEAHEQDKITKTVVLDE